MTATATKTKKNGGYKLSKADRDHMKRLDANMRDRAYETVDYISESGKTHSRKFNKNKIPATITVGGKVCKRIVISPMGKGYVSVFPFESPQLEEGWPGTSVNKRTGNVVVPSRAVLNEVLARSKSDPNGKAISWDQ